MELNLFWPVWIDPFQGVKLNCCWYISYEWLNDIYNIYYNSAGSSHTMYMYRVLHFYRLLSIEIKVSGIKCVFKILLVMGYALIPRHRPNPSGCNSSPVASNVTSGIHCVVVFHLVVLEFGCWTVETEKQTHTIWKQMYMSANNINVCRPIILMC